MNKKLCKNCSAILTNNAKFCSHCGNPVEVANNTFHNVNIKSISPQSVNFNLLGRKFTYSSDIVDYNKVRILFSQNAMKNKIDFISYYNSNVKSFDDLFYKAFPNFVERVILSVRFGVSILMKYDVYFVDENKLAELASGDIDIQKYISPFIEAAEKIQEYAENFFNYRSISRAGRGKWQGGGFGIGGAIKGALTASMLNLGTDMLRGIGDCITNASDKAKIENMKNDIFNDNKTLEFLEEGIYNCCFDVFYSVWGVLENEGKIPVVNFDTVKINAIANNIILQYKSNKMLYERVIDVLCECIQIYPYSLSYYSALYSILKNSKQEVMKIAKYFGLEFEYKDAIIKIDNSRLVSIKEMPNNTIQDIDRKINEINELTQYNPYLDVTALLSELNEKRKYISQQIQFEKSTNMQLDQVSNIRRPIDDAIKSNNLDFVWSCISRGNVYAEYALERFYNKQCKDCIDDYNVYQMEDILRDVQIRANNGDIYSKYLIAAIRYDMFIRDRRNTSKAQDAAKVILEVAENGIISAIAMKGFWGSHDYNNATRSKSDAIKLLEKAASAQHPTALSWLGSFYMTGKHGLSQNKEKAEMLLKLAAAYDQPFAKKEIEKLNSKSTSSDSCFITTAVCKSLGREDDCYELTSFRSFRDKWIKNLEDGESLINEYYSIAPVIVRNIDKKENKDTIYFNIWEEYLKECLFTMERGQYQRCKEIYCGMVYDLKLKYFK